MNHCHDCNSDYSAPGTCNCFAPGGKRYAAPSVIPSIPTVPYVPYVPYHPYPGWYPSLPYWGDGTITITVGDRPAASPYTTTVWATDSNVARSLTVTS